jgi:PAS domain S-box-containing protein
MSEAPSTILIVDDAADVRETLAALLADQGYRLAFAADGPDSLVAAAALQPDAILLDVMMPGMDGFEVCRRLRSDPRLAEAPVIMITALDDRTSRLEGLGVGADEFLTKPFDRAELLIRLATITRLSRYRRLLDERTRLAQLVEMAPDGILAVDASGGVQLANPALCRLLGLDGGADNRTARLTALVAPDRRGDWETCLGRLGTGSHPPCEFESVLLRRNGERIPVAVVAGQVDWQERPAILFMIRDITERKRAELLEIERHEIASELHDGLAQIVTGTHLQAQVIAQHYHPRSAAGREALEKLCWLARESVTEIRRLLAGLRPTALEDLGLAGALRLQVLAMEADGWTITYHEALGGITLPSPLETALFRVAQEALSNIRKHAGATVVLLTLRVVGPTVELVVQDWGCGFDPSALQRDYQPGKQLGLRTMQDRIALAGGTFSLSSKAGSGTRMSVAVPLPSEAGGNQHERQSRASREESSGQARDRR